MTVPAIREALARVAPNADSSDLDRYAASIALQGSIAKAERLPASRRGTAPALKLLRTVNKHIGALMKSIDKMQADEIIALRQTGAPERLEFLQTLAGYNEHIIAAYDALDAGAGLVARGRGRRADLAPDKIARYVETIYERLTGEAPKRRTEYGGGLSSGDDFHELLHSVFDALKIQAGAEYRSRKRLAEK